MSSRPGRDSIKEEMKIDADRVGDQIQLAQSLTHVGEYTNNEDFTHPCYWPSPKEKREGTEKAHEGHMASIPGTQHTRRNFKHQNGKGVAFKAA